jgi:hypothetical protein
MTRQSLIRDPPVNSAGAVPTSQADRSPGRSEHGSRHRGEPGFTTTSSADEEAPVASSKVCIPVIPASESTGVAI